MLRKSQEQFKRLMKWEFTIINISSKVHSDEKYMTQGKKPKTQECTSDQRNNKISRNRTTPPQVQTLCF